jgi:hypothetical protein
MSTDQYLPPGQLPASRPDVLTRPKALTGLIAALDTAGWSYGVRWGMWDDGATRVRVTAVPPWDERIRIEAAWERHGDDPLKRTACNMQRPYRALGPAGITEVMGLIAAAPEPRDDRQPASEVSA